MNISEVWLFYSLCSTRSSAILWSAFTSWEKKICAPSYYTFTILPPFFPCVSLSSSYTPPCWESWSFRSRTGRELEQRVWKQLGPSYLDEAREDVAVMTPRHVINDTSPFYRARGLLDRKSTKLRPLLKNAFDL